MADDLRIARYPEEGTSLPYLVRLPLGRDGIVLQARETWPRTSKVYCHRGAEAQARFPSVPIVFCETRALAQEWLYRWFGACLHERSLTASQESAVTALSTPSAAQIRKWALARGISVSDRGRVPADLRAAYLAARGG